LNVDIVVFYFIKYNSVFKYMYPLTPADIDDIADGVDGEDEIASWQTQQVDNSIQQHVHLLQMENASHEENEAHEEDVERGSREGQVVD
jgi:hypothetical protein